jgi:hypothetical protein
MALLVSVVDFERIFWTPLGLLGGMQARIAHEMSEAELVKSKR